MSTNLEKVLSSSYKKQMVLYISSHPESFDELLALALNNNSKLSWRAAWMIHHFMHDNDVRLQKHIKKMITLLPDVNESSQREFLKIISRMNIYNKDEGILFNHCISIWEKINKSSSIRYHAIKTVMRIAHKYPELTNEIDFFLQDHYLETLSPAIRKILIREIHHFAK
ncbi:MAG: hypothetical protein HPY79_09255 [Bacteroidales bacterium]|nr:hypothetical protein [Bacteroidales bacterium]